MRYPETGRAQEYDLAMFSRKGDLEHVCDLIDAGVYLDRGDCDDIPLSQAAINGREQICIALLEGGADANAGFGDPLIRAACSSHERSLEVLNILLDGGADPNIWEFEAPLNCVLRCNSERTKGGVQLLLKHGANPNRGSRDPGVSPLCTAIEYARLNCVDPLIDAGASLTPVVDNIFWTPLGSAAKVLDFVTFDYLVERGADIGLIDKENKTLLDRFLEIDDAHPVLGYPSQIAGMNFEHVSSELRDRGLSRYADLSS